MFKKKVLSVFLCLLFLNSIYSKEDPVCIETSVCLCNLNDNKYIDISPLNKDNLTITNGNLTYYYYPCQDVLFNATNLNITNECTTGTTLCLFDETGPKKFINLGITTEGKFNNILPKSLIYTHGNVVTTVLLECAPDANTSTLAFISSDQNNHKLSLFTSDACIKISRTGLSLGSALLILCATIFGVYFIGGALILHCLRGARGREMIPNIDFWTSIPGLVKDGLVFLLSGCNPSVISSAESYDRI
ncbi:hypothetical protein FQA39_LY03235 [Lamprigera yunnana]|nr:hypothetical protein FQA39_LY03235 [Lamprigera yunnana]